MNDLSAQARALAEVVVPTGGATLEFIGTAKGLLPRLADSLDAAEAKSARWEQELARTADERDTAQAELSEALAHVNALMLELDEAPDA